MQMRILALCGSLRAGSSNKKLLDYIGNTHADKFKIHIWEKLTNLPYFNVDLDTDKPPLPVSELRMAIRNADAVLIATPEYVYTLPGALKNAIEWTVSSGEFNQKPVGLIVGAASGASVHDSLFKVMATLMADIPDNCRLHIPGLQGAVKNGVEPNLKRKLDEFATNFYSALQAES